MASIDRTSFAGGWVPDADSLGGPADGLLRMDNCVLDQLGTLALRQGSALVASYGADAHSLYTTVLNGTRVRFVGSGSSVYANGASLVSGIPGSTDVAFGSYRSQVVFARSTTKQKYDGTTLRNWGVAMTGGIPTAVGHPPDGFLLVNAAESAIPSFVVTEGQGATTWITGPDGTANGAAVFTPLDATHRGTMLMKWLSPFDATIYPGGTVASDNDLLTFWVRVTEPNNLVAITVMVDVNTPSGTPFQNDYYIGVFTQDESTLLNTLNPQFTVTGAGHPTVTPVPTGLPFSVAGLIPGSSASALRFDANVWTKLAIRRGSLNRIGSTAGHDWTTVIAVQVLAVSVGTPQTSIAFGNMQLEVANAVGPHQWAYVYAFNSGTYVGLSAPSAFSAPLQLQAANATLTVPADAGRDPQINEIWVYRFILNNYYRVAVQTGVSGTGIVTINDTTADTDGLTADLIMEADNTVPPDNIIGIAGPYYDRLFVLTASACALSRPINPDSFSASQVIQIAGTDETCFWIRKTFGGLYIGTSKDIYRIDGTAADLPDGSIDAVFSPLSIDHPPIGDGVAQDGNLLVYLASDGWRSVASAGSISLVGATSLLYAKQLTRYGVGPVNLLGRFRAAIQQQQLAIITPEGANAVPPEIGFVSRQCCTLTLLTSPTRVVQAVGQTHTAGNLLVACFHSRQDGSTPITQLANTAGDVWLRSTRSPDEDYAGGIHYFETWYVLATHGAVNDVVTVTGAWANAVDTTLTVYEFAGGGAAFQYVAGSDGTGGSGFDQSHGDFGEIVSSVMAITQPSVVVANYRSVSTANPPISPSGIQSAGLDGQLFDSYQFTGVSGTANASYSSATFPQWGILAVVFTAAVPPAAPALYRHAPVVKSWYRFTYPMTLRSLFVEPDGTLIAGDLSGAVWQLDTGTTDNGTLIPIQIDTHVEDNGQPFLRKDAWDLAVRVDTGGATVSVNVHLDDAQTPALTPTVAVTPIGLVTASLAAIAAPWYAVGLRIAASCRVFRFAGFHLGYRDRPPAFAFTEPKPLAPSPVRRRFGGLTIAIDTLGSPVTITPILDSVPLAPFTLTTTDPQVRTLTLPTVVGQDLWASVSETTGIPFELVQLAPIVSETLPQRVQGLTPKQLGETPGVKTISALQIRLCTFGVTRILTAVLDGVVRTDLTVPALSDVATPVDVTLAFPATVMGVEVALSTDGDVELYGWTPVVTSSLPIGVLAWENRPGVPSATRRRFGGLTLQIRTLASAIVVPILDGVAQPGLTIGVGDLLGHTVTFPALVGRDLWASVTSAQPFNILGAEAVVLETLPTRFQGTTPRKLGDAPAIKVLSGIRARACTFGVPRLFAVVIDGVAQPGAVSMTSDPNEPADITVPCPTSAEGTEIALTVDGDVELYAWEPLVSARRPIGVLSWDSGAQLDLGTEELVWLRHLRLKVRASAPLTITPWFDGQVFPAVTVPVTPGIDTIVPIDVGPHYVGRQPRLVITSAQPFNPYWVDPVYRNTGSATDKRRQRIPVTLGTGGDA